MTMMMMIIIIIINIEYYTRRITDMYNNNKAQALV